MSACSEFATKAVNMVGSISEMERMTGITRKRISLWMRGGSVPKLSSLKKIALAVGVDVPKECEIELEDGLLPEDDYRRYRSYSDVNPHKSICWWCRNSVPTVRRGKYISGCSWSMRFEPVDGWETVESGAEYAVVSCPEYVRG